MFTRLDYSSALEYSIIRRYTNIVYYYYYSRVEVVECSGQKPYWSVAGRIYLLIVGKSRDYRTFTAAQRSEIHWEMSLPGFGIGMINVDFNIDGI